MDTTGKQLRRLILAAASIGMSLLTGCAQPTPHFNVTFGDAVRMANALQTINPEASRNADPVLGVDSQAATNSISRYQKSFMEKEPQPTIIIPNVGQ